VAAGRSVYTNLSVIISVCISLTVGNLRTSHFASTMSAAGKLIYVFSRVLRHSHRHTHIHMRRAKWADARRREWGGGEIYGLKLNPPTLPPSTMRVRVRGTDTLWTWLRTPALFSFSLCASSAVRLLTPFTPTPAQRRAHTHTLH
jgi:hypothetical protein